MTHRKKKLRVEGFRVLEHECIWMKAGVVNFRTCDNAYDCYNCPFDDAMRKAMGLDNGARATHPEPAWVEYLKERYQGASRPCRHVLTGRIDAPKICPNNYECYHCTFDQMLDDMDLVRQVDTPVYRSASGFELAVGYYYHYGHTWARFEHGGRVRIGFDDFWRKIFGPAASLELPPPGAQLHQSQVACTFARNGHRAAVLSPVTGTVLTINPQVVENPSPVNRDPYCRGWLFIVEPDAPKKNLKSLFSETTACSGWRPKAGRCSAAWDPSMTAWPPRAGPSAMIFSAITRTSGGGNWSKRF